MLLKYGQVYSGIPDIYPVDPTLDAEHEITLPDGYLTDDLLKEGNVISVLPWSFDYTSYRFKEIMLTGKLVSIDISSISMKSGIASNTIADLSLSFSYADNTLIVNNVHIENEDYVDQLAAQEAVDKEYTASYLDRKTQDELVSRRITFADLYPDLVEKE